MGKILKQAMFFVVCAWMFWGPTLVFAQSDAEKFASVGWWDVWGSKSEGICVASSVFEGGTRFSIGFGISTEAWFLEKTNESWHSIKVGQEYDLEYVFDGRRSWKGPERGIPNGIISVGLVDGFIDDFIRSNSMQLIFDGREIDRISLRSTRNAMDAVSDCIRRNFLNIDPFTSVADDPFSSDTASSNTYGSENESMPKFYIHGSSIFYPDNTLALSLRENLTSEEIAQRFPGFRTNINVESVGELGNIFVYDGSDLLFEIWTHPNTNEIGHIRSYSTQVVLGYRRKIGMPIMLFESLGVKCWKGEEGTCQSSVSAATKYIVSGVCASSEFFDFTDSSRLSILKECDRIGGFEIFINQEENTVPVELQIGSRAGMVVSITLAEELGTEVARIETLHTRDNSKAFCRGYLQDKSDECIEQNFLERELRGPLTGYVAANCDTGEFITLSGNTYKFVGRRELGDQRTTTTYIIRQVAEGGLGDALDASMASGYGVLLEIFSILCPNRRVEIRS